MKKKSIYFQLCSIFFFPCLFLLCSILYHLVQLPGGYKEKTEPFQSFRLLHLVSIEMWVALTRQKTINSVPSKQTNVFLQWENPHLQTFWVSLSFALVWFYGISTIVDYSMPTPLYTYILNIYDLIGFYGISTIVGYSMPTPLYTYILNIYDLIGFYGISTIVGYLMPTPLYTYIYWIYMIWLGFMAYQPL